MKNLTLKSYHIYYWGFEDSPNSKPFKNALFEDKESARLWLEEQGVFVSLDDLGDNLQLCDCFECDHCLRNPTGRLS